MENYFNCMYKYLSNLKKPLLLVGKSGCGKSILPKPEAYLEQLNTLKEMYDKKNENHKCIFIVSSTLKECDLFLSEENCKRFKIIDFK